MHGWQAPSFISLAGIPTSLTRWHCPWTQRRWMLFPALLQAGWYFIIIDHCFPTYKLKGKLLIYYIIGENLMKILANPCKSCQHLQNHRMADVERVFGGHLLNHLLNWGHLEPVAQHCVQRLWNISKDGDSRICLGNLCQCLVILTLKMCFLRVRVVLVCAYHLHWTPFRYLYTSMRFPEPFSSPG